MEKFIVLSCVASSVHCFVNLDCVKLDARNIYEGSDSMTKNQIDYWNLVENQRHNAAVEAFNQGTLSESKRSNLAKEAETNRSNVSKETETRRSNMMKELLTQSEQAETHRSNVAKETETRRSNLANEEIRSEANVINREHYERMDEETARSNRRNEQIRAADVGVKYLGNEYSKQYNLGNLSLNQESLAESKRQNRVRELYNQQTLAETTRSALASEQIGRSQAAAANTNAFANVRNSEANLINAATNQQNASTRQNELEQRTREYQLDVDKWNEAGRSESQSKAALSDAQAERAWNQTDIDVYNAETNRMRLDLDTRVNTSNVINNWVRSWTGLLRPIGGKR